MEIIAITAMVVCLAQCGMLIVENMELKKDWQELHYYNMELMLKIHQLENEKEDYTK